MPTRQNGAGENELVNRSPDVEGRKPGTRTLSMRS